VLLLIAACYRPARVAMTGYLSTPVIALSVVTLMVLLGMLVAATGFFGEKYHFVGLDRYYLPAKPLYFLLFVGPLLLIRGRAIQVTVSVVMLVGCSWIVQQEWTRPYERWLAANREVTSYGEWARSFSPGADELYRHLKGEKSDELIVVSNFHDYITLETGIAAVPIPASPEILGSWVERIMKARKIDRCRVMFVIDPDPRWRSYFATPIDQVIDRFGLTDRKPLPSNATAMVFGYSPTKNVSGNRLSSTE